MPIYEQLRVIFRVAGFDASVRFYEKNLGMTRLAAWGRPEDPGIILHPNE